MISAVNNICVGVIVDLSEVVSHYYRTENTPYTLSPYRHTDIGT